MEGPKSSLGKVAEENRILQGSDGKRKRTHPTAGGEKKQLQKTDDKSETIDPAKLAK